ncbi:glycogen synthase GlgA [Megasphaera vaginalis (ex Bordigoni et al. 2020)]|uniref:glycogen synthase GlgA n=1 Tax=Megasphaera vaginalis (ex Bordigoni et al. 2020) TaxID=2045301 RepID=UPI001F1F10D1|nr:glycogen synthase GlgA [Megasphaera vaginalis (ex Bordigoni et al. 2020)]
MMKVLFAASEAVPFVKTGGLADVMGALPKSLAARGMDVRVVIPKYSQIGETWLKEMKEVTTGTVNLAWRQLYYGVEEIRKDGVRFYFIDNEQYFKRDKLYGFGDDAERFAYFCRAVLAMLPKIGFKPDVVHCNDWHTGLLGAFLKEDFIHDPFYVQMKVIYTIHNLKYQGIFDPFVMNDVIGLPYALFSGGKLECDGAVNYMKSGMVYADQITTVSPTYAEEITYPYFGERLDSYIRTCKARLTGIINGLDEDMYDPENDEFIPVQYTPATLQSGKRGNKQRLQRELGLPERNVPLFAIVTRLIEDKGMDLVLRIIDELLSEDIQFVLVGTGDSAYENAFRQAAQRHPTKMAVRILFHEALAHRVYAAADFFLMPSRYEPCGLSQLIALKYGTVPIVRETGGLKDTVIPFDKYTGKGNGLSFLNFNAHELLFTAKQGLGYYEVPVIWEQLVKNAAASDYGWQRSAAAYAALYEKVSEN